MTPTTLHPEDTIAALASAPGTAARGIVRVSGPRVVELIYDLLEPPWDKTLRGARCWPGTIRVRDMGLPIPVDVYLWPDRRSYTGQPLAEIHTVGSPPILEAVLSELFARGVRPAQPGEFTLRAFLAGRMDLMQAEAVLGVIDSRTDSELRTALDQLAGGISSSIVHLRGDLLDLLADLEAGLDFADEAIEFVSHGALVGRIGLAKEAVVDLLKRAESRSVAANRPKVVLAGAPNAGKSTLFNALAGRDAAIVSAERGTTRDYLAADILLNGIPVTVIDTAGEESAADDIGGEAQRRRTEQLEQADLILYCVAADDATIAVPSQPEKTIGVLTKVDLLEGDVRQSDRLALSARTGIGLDELKAAIRRRLVDESGGESRLLGSTAARCRDNLHSAAAALDRALEIARHEADQELLAIEIREALEHLGEIVGAVYTDDLLDRIFSKFCIGK
jgi:tRNA modification GTPase